MFKGAQCPVAKAAEEGRRQKEQARHLSDAVIDELVTHMLQNADINISVLPDYMERRIYANIVRILIGNVTELLRHVKIEVLNHVITMRIDPVAHPTADQEQKVDETANGSAR